MNGTFELLTNPDGSVKLTLRCPIGNVELEFSDECEFFAFVKSDLVNATMLFWEPA